MNNILLISQDQEYIKAIERKISPSLYVFNHADGWENALKIFDTQPIYLVIVDLSNELDDQKLLNQIREAYPNIIRISISDIQAGQEHFMPRKISNSRIQCHKGISVDELFALLEKVIEIDANVKDKKLVNLMSSMKHLPTVPQVYYQMSNMITNNASVEEIANKLEEDPSITSNILKLANTAFYNAKTASIRQAIMYIGLINVKNIILSNAVFGNDGLDPKTRELHWEHVKITNKLLIRFYQDIIGKKLSNNISSVGLLHDIGSVVLMSNFPKEFEAIVKTVKENSALKFHDVEREVIGFNHASIGGYLLDLWGLPYPVIEAALYHHEPMNPKIINHELVKAVHIANHYAWKVVHYKKYDNVIDTAVFEAFDITQEQFEKYFSTIREKL